jgi:hypothetical protein
VGSAGLSLSGFGALSVGGVNGTSVSGTYTAVWTAVPNNLSAGIAYSDSCDGVPSGVPSINGSGGGTFTLTGGSAVVGGAMMPNATLSGSLNLMRHADGVFVTLYALSVTAGTGSTAVAVNLDNTITGESPTGVIWANGPGVCGAGGQVTNQVGQIVGLTLQAV